MDKGEIIIYQDDSGATELHVRMVNQSVWLTQLQMAGLFGRDKSLIIRHIRNAVEEGEIEEHSVVANIATTASDGKTYQIDHYNLDVIISVGYRVKSLAGVRFRKWATKLITEYMIKGFAMDDSRLKEPDNDYFDELLVRIRDIRSSEKRFHRKVCDIFAESSDYDKSSASAAEFFAIVQNKLHWTAHGNNYLI